MSGIKRFVDGKPIPAALRGGVVAIGNFDGVHRGHQAVLERALEEGRRRNVPALVLTFEPHPRKLFRPDLAHFVLTPPTMRAVLLGDLGFHAVVEYPFTRGFSELSAESFITEVLDHTLGITHVVTGFDFHFGKDRRGGPAFLMESGNRHGFGVTLVDAFRDEGAHVISSSRIRELLAAGDVVQANGLLGYRFTIESSVIKGRQLGRTLGFPTANMALPADTALKEGIYAVRFRRVDDTLFDGVASFGRRPTVTENGAPLLETFLFDFDGDLYDETCRVSFFGLLRSEEKFDSLDELHDQMTRDKAEAKAMLAGVKPFSELDVKVAF